MAEVLIKVEESGERIDALLARCVDGLTRAAAQRLLEAGAVTAAGRALRKNDRPRQGDVISVVLPDEAEETELAAEDIPLDVVYEDGDVIVVNKPRGMVVHPAPGHPDGTLVNALLHHCGDSLSGIGGEFIQADGGNRGLLIITPGEEQDEQEQQRQDSFHRW